MAELKTKVNKGSVADFIDAIADAQVRDDCRTIVKIMQAATKAQPEMWGSAIVGFGRRQQVYASGKTAEWMVIGFSPRKQNTTLYLGGLEKNGDLMAHLGTHSCGKGCLYIKRLSDIRLPVLKKLVQASVRQKTETGAAAKSKSSQI
ncbi:MAG TPA: DUF1801 domain-containing protein [Candidatus Angelobacter sp.]|nr:DUF1801 domain-containing protein [Candidatus Angelobacter sp.]